MTVETRLSLMMMGPNMTHGLVLEPYGSGWAGLGATWRNNADVLTEPLKGGSRENQFKRLI